MGIEDDGQTLQIVFLRCSTSDILKLNRFSARLAKSKTYTDDWYWRFNLKEDDVFDCMDDYGSWYKSTVLQSTVAEEKDVDGDPI